MKTPFFSIITPTFQAKDFLAQTCESLYSQSFESYEHLIIDGGSTDGSIEWLKQNLSANARLVSESDQGIYDAINKGIKLAKGKLVNILNAGDRLESNVLSQISQEYKEQPFVMAVGQYYWINPKQNVLVSPNLVQLAKGYPVCHQAVFYEPQLHETLGLYDLKYPKAADYRFIRKTQEHAELRILSFPVCYYDLSGVSAKHFLLYAKEVRDIDQELGVSFGTRQMTYFNKWWRFQVRRLLKVLRMDFLILIYQKIIHSS